MQPTWRKTLIVATVFLATHAATAVFYAHRYATGAVRDGLGETLSLEMTPQQWARATAVRDSAAYLRAAVNVAAGKGMTIDVPGAKPPRTELFCYWGPGGPFVLGWWLRLTRGRTMFSLFMFAVVSEAAFGLLALATVALWTRSTVALALTACCTGFCPPLQTYFDGINLTASEVVGLLPLALMVFAMGKAFLAFRAAAPPFWPAVRNWRALAWFAAAGVAIGLHSLVRDSGQVFALFGGMFLIGRGVLFDRKRLVLAIASAAALIVATAVVRWPVQHWNQSRVGRAMVSSSGDVAVWRYGLWMLPDRQGVRSFVASTAIDATPEQVAWWEQDLYDWCVSAGFGMGRHLDAAAADRVEQYYLDAKPWPATYALGQFAMAVLQHPADAIRFKAERLPVLWLGAEKWPDMRIDFTSIWCLGFYLMLGLFVVTQFRRGGYVPEPIYLYLVLIVLASPLIHFEFRYTFPIWNGLVLVPGLLAERVLERANSIAKSRTGCQPVRNKTDGLADRPAVVVANTKPVEV
jgi:hypothetical protein